MRKKFKPGDLVLIQIDYGIIFICELVVIHNDWGSLKKVEIENHKILYMMFSENSHFTLISKGEFA